MEGNWIRLQDDRCGRSFQAARWLDQHLGCFRPDEIGDYDFGDRSRCTSCFTDEGPMGDDRLEDLELPSTALDEPPARPTWVRYQVLATACSLAVITYIHRVGFATASAEFKELARSERPASRLHDGRVHDRLRPLRDPLGLSRRPVRRPEHPGGHHPGGLDAHRLPGPRGFPAAERASWSSPSWCSYGFFLVRSRRGPFRRSRG